MGRYGGFGWKSIERGLVEGVEQGVRVNGHSTCTRGGVNPGLLPGIVAGLKHGLKALHFLFAAVTFFHQHGDHGIPKGDFSL